MESSPSFATKINSVATVSEKVAFGKIVLDPVDRIFNLGSCLGQGIGPGRGNVEPGAKPLVAAMPKITQYIAIMANQVSFECHNGVSTFGHTCFFVFFSIQWRGTANDSLKQRPDSMKYRKSTIIVALIALCCNDMLFAQDNLAGDGPLVKAVEQAYVYGYPLLLMDASNTVMASGTDGRAPINQISHIREFPDHAFTDVVTPNADTLYSIAWLDLKATPMVFSVPETGNRYYVMQFLDGWTNVFASIGSRTTGNGKGTFLITGPGWKGDVPEGMTLVKSPTNMAWLLGRTQTNGIKDYESVHKIQDQYELEPYRKDAVKRNSTLSTDTKTAPVVQIDKLDAVSFFNRLNKLMVDNPPTDADTPVLDALAAIGIAPGKAFAKESFSAPDFQKIEKAYVAARERSIDVVNQSFGNQSGCWTLMPGNIGNYETDYETRMVVARVGLGANLQEDAVYPSCRRDLEGKPLSGKHDYIVHFTKGQLPPVKAFWSLTMYDNRQCFIANPINRYAIGDRDDLKFDEDGGLTIYMQHESPGKEKESNWLPAPLGEFNIFLRLYWPDQSILDNTWPLPEIKKVR